MDCLENEMLLSWLNHYGSFALFCLLALGIVALPIPDETLLVLSGILIRNGHLHATPTVIAAYAGGIAGITISYILGKTCGYYLVHKYGSWIGLTQSNFDRAHQWFERYGKWTLLFGYFIPGVRHFTGLVAGVVKLEYNNFAIFAYTGEMFWASLFLSIGYFFGNYCFSAFGNLDVKLHEVFLGLLAVLAIYFVVRILLNKREKPSP